MQIELQSHTLDKAKLVADVQLGDSLYQAAQQGRRADFALMLALLSEDVGESVPICEQDFSSAENDFHHQFELTKPANFVAQAEDHALCQKQAFTFHHAGIVATRLFCQLVPSALHFSATNCQSFTEDVYHNLNGHTRRRIAGENVALDKFDGNFLLQTLRKNRLDSAVAFV
ncbi:MAG: VC2046/SO_2500 family protein [Vibrionaceae bacterium]